MEAGKETEELRGWDGDGRRAETKKEEGKVEG